MNEVSATHARPLGRCPHFVGDGGQVMDATVGVIVLLPSEENMLLVGAASIAIALTLTSVVLFRDSGL